MRLYQGHCVSFEWQSSQARRRIPFTAAEAGTSAVTGGLLVSTGTSWMAPSATSRVSM